MHLKLCWIWQHCMNFCQLFTQRNSKSNNNGSWHTQLVQTKFNMGTLALITIISLLTAAQSFGLMCPNWAEPNIPLACISADQCLKFCDDMPSAAMTPAMNNTQNLDPDYLVTSFPVWDTDWLKCMLMDCWAQLSQDTLNRVINQLLKKTDNGYQGEGCQYWISSGLTVYANYRCCYFHCLFEWKIG